MTDNQTGATIRPIEPDDLDAILDLDRRITGKERTPTYQDLINEVFGGEMGMSFVAEADGGVVGLVLARVGYVPERISEVCLIQVIGMDPQYRGRGIATRLVQAVIDEACAKGMRTVYVIVDRQDDQLRALFEHMDFSEGDLIHYAKDI